MAGPGRPGRGWVGRHEVVAYLVLAYLISWSIWPLVLVNPGSTPLVPFGPALAAILVTAVAGGRRELLELLRQLWRWRVAARWYGLALGLPLVITAAAMGAALLAGESVPHWEPSDVLQVVASLITTFVVVGLFEELGWRGFLLPRLQSGRRALKASMLVGLVWAPWHLPELVSDPGQRPLSQFLIIILAQSVLLAWLYNSTGASLPVVMLFHAGLNSFAKFFLSSLEGSLYQIAWWVLAGGLVLLTVAVVAYAGGISLAKGEDRSSDKAVHHPSQHSSA